MAELDALLETVEELALALELAADDEAPSDEALALADDSLPPEDALDEALLPD